MPKLPRFEEEEEKHVKVVRGPNEHVIDERELSRMKQIMGFSNFDSSKYKDHSHCDTSLKRNVARTIRD